MNNLFQRNCGADRAVSAFGVSSLIAGFSSGLAGNFLIAGIFGTLAIFNSSNVKKYSSEVLELIINDYQSGKPIPPHILKKLKAMDFQ